VLDLHLDAVVEGILVRGTLGFRVALPCARCLEPQELAFEVDVAELFVDPTKRDERDEEDPGYELVDDLTAIDLTTLVRDALLIDLPVRVLCREDCQGLCPVCGADRNQHRLRPPPRPRARPPVGCARRPRPAGRVSDGPPPARPPTAATDPEPRPAAPDRPPRSHRWPSRSGSCRARAPVTARRSGCKTSAPTYATCKRCKAPIRPHTVCGTCGTYAGRQVVEVD
jgi:ribosomal protein L32